MCGGQEGMRKEEFGGQALSEQWKGLGLWVWIEVGVGVGVGVGGGDGFVKEGEKWRHCLERRSRV